MFFWPVDVLVAAEISARSVLNSNSTFNLACAECERDFHWERLDNISEESMVTKDMTVSATSISSNENPESFFIRNLARSYLFWCVWFATRSAWRSHLLTANIRWYWFDRISLDLLKFSSHVLIVPRRNVLRALNGSAFQQLCFAKKAQWRYQELKVLSKLQEEWRIRSR